MASQNKVVIHNPTSKKHEPMVAGDQLAGSLIQLSTDVGNSLVLGTDGGLKLVPTAQLPDDQVLSGDNTGSVAVTLTPTVIGDQTNYMIKADTKVDPAAGNIATVSSAGVFVPAPVIPTPTAATAPSIVDDGTTTTQYFGNNDVALGSPLKWVSTDGGTTVTPVYTASGVSGSTPVVNASKKIAYGSAPAIPWDNVNVKASVVITFDSPFPSPPFITPVIADVDQNTGDPMGVAVGNVTTTGFTLLRAVVFVSSGGVFPTVSWKAEEK